MLLCISISKLSEIELATSDNQMGHVNKFVEREQLKENIKILRLTKDVKKRIR